MPNIFTIRTYGILINKGSVLLTYERMPNFSFTKFPGGGLEYGEGLKDCLIREFKEETGLAIEVKQHLYTTDYFQPSAFNKQQQLLAVYYLVDAKEINLVTNTEIEINVNGKKEYLTFFWQPLLNFNMQILTFPTDRIALAILQKTLTNNS